MSVVSLTSVLKYAFSLFLGVMGFLPYEQTSLNPEEGLVIETVIEVKESCPTLAYLSGDSIPVYLKGENCNTNS